MNAYEITEISDQMTKTLSEFDKEVDSHMKDTDAYLQYQKETSKWDKIKSPAHDDYLEYEKAIQKYYNLYKLYGELKTLLQDALDTPSWGKLEILYNEIQPTEEKK